MHRFLSFGVGTMLLASPAVADQCAQRGDLGAMEAAIRVASDCRQAADIARACAFGAGGDVALGATVMDVCERDFMSGLDRRGRASYARQRQVCSTKYGNQAGTMYRSAEAFCEVGVAERFSKRALGAKPR